MASLYEKKLSLSIARETIEQFFTKKEPIEKILPLTLQEKGSCFVTLIKDNQSRGCCGSVFPFQSLVKDIQTNALQAAFLDPRFPALSQEDLPTISIELLVNSGPFSGRDGNRLTSRVLWERIERELRTNVSLQAKLIYGLCLRCYRPVIIQKNNSLRGHVVPKIF